MERRFRSRYGRMAVIRAALLIFALAGVLIAVVVYALDRSARSSNEQQAATELASMARVSSSTFATMQANLKTRAGELASSSVLQRAVLAHDVTRLRAIARGEHERIVLGNRAIGVLPPEPRLTAGATLMRNGRVLSSITIGIPLDKSFLDVLAVATPMPRHAALVLASDDRVIAGGPAGAAAHIRKDRLQLGSVAFDASSAALSKKGVSVIAVEPVSAVAARIAPYRQRLLFIAAMTLALAAGLAVRLARPVARVLRDVAQLTRQAQTDALTGIANRRALDERLDDEVDHARRTATSLSFVIADIDGFKSFNDTHGHQTGDEVLRQVARVFADAVRELDLPGRFGGEEIAVVLPGTNLSGARRLAERVRTGLEELEIRTPSGETVKVTASFGAAAYPLHSTADALVAAADAALYEAKRNGKNRVETATAKKKAVVVIPDPASA